MNAVDQLTDIERHDYCHTDPAAEGDLITVRVTLDVIVSREQWDALHETGTDPLKIRESVQRWTLRTFLGASEGQIDGVVNAMLRRFAGVEVARRFDRGRRR